MITKAIPYSRESYSDSRIRQINIGKGLRLYVLRIDELTAEDSEQLKLQFPQRWERAQGFKFEADRLRCLAAGYLLLKILGIEESELEIGEYGKPYLREEAANNSDSSIKTTKAARREFNLSHSGDYTVLAVAEYTEDNKGLTIRSVGVDIERIDERNISVADKVYTAEEMEWMSEQTEKRFWPLWTMKEAVSKAIGSGLTMDYRSFSVLPMLKGSGIEADDRSSKTDGSSPETDGSSSETDGRTMELEGSLFCGWTMLWEAYSLSLVLELNKGTL